MKKWLIISAAIPIFPLSFWGWQPVVVYVLLFALVIGLIIKFWLVIVPENWVASVIRPFTGRVLRVLGPGYHFIIRPVEKVSYVFKTVPQKINMNLTHVFSQEHIPMDMECAAIFRICLDQVPQSSMAEILTVISSELGALVKLLLEGCIRDLAAEQPARKMIHASNIPDLRRDLLNRLNQQLVPNGIFGMSVLISNASLPAEYQMALIQTQAQPINTQTTVAVLNAMQQTAGLWRPEDREFVTNIEEIRAIQTSTIDQSRSLFWNRILRKDNNNR